MSLDEIRSILTDYTEQLLFEMEAKELAKQVGGVFLTGCTNDVEKGQF